MLNLITPLLYLALSLVITLRVGRALSANGLIFLTHHLRGETALAQAINNLLLIGFYLINAGYILLVLNLNDFSRTDFGLPSQLYFLTQNLGLVILMLGALHMVLLYVLSHWQPQRLKLDAALTQDTPMPNNPNL